MNKIKFFAVIFVVAMFVFAPVSAFAVSNENCIERTYEGYTPETLTDLMREVVKTVPNWREGGCVRKGDLTVLRFEKGSTNDKRLRIFIKPTGTGCEVRYFGAVYNRGASFVKSTFAVLPKYVYDPMPKEEVISETDYIIDKIDERAKQTSGL